MDKIQQDALDAMRELLTPIAAEKNLTLCTSRHHIEIATVRVFWPVGDRPDPCYCAPCARWAKKVLDTLGVKYRDEPLPMPPGVSRGINLQEQP